MTARPKNITLERRQARQFTRVAGHRPITINDEKRKTRAL